MRVVGIEGAPSAVAALHADDPLRRAVDRVAIACRIKAVEGERDRGGVVEIGIMGVLKLERPSTGTQAGTSGRPIADHLQNLLALQPVQSPLQRRAEPAVI